MQKDEQNISLQENEEMSLEPGKTLRLPQMELLLPEEEENIPGKHNKQLFLEQDLSSIQLTEKPKDKYRFRKSIGVGGMKTVLQVYDNDTMRDVALAMMPDAAQRSRQEVLAFIREARLTASLEHPNIIPVYDIGMDSAASPYFTMKLLRGETLASILKKLDSGDELYREKYSFSQLLRLWLRICNGTAFAHSKGVLHLDLKPENIQIGDFSEVQILDWGIARPVPAGDESNPKKKEKKGIRITVGMEDEMKGTPGYMAPEQVAPSPGNPLCVETDIYALGALLYTIVTYKSPAEGTSLKKILQDTLKGNITPPSLRVPGRNVPSGIEAVIRKAMALSPEKRYHSVQELSQEVLAFLDGFATEAEEASLLRKSFLFFRRHLLLNLSIMITLFLLLVMGFFLHWEYTRQKAGWEVVSQGDFTGGKWEYAMKNLEFRDRFLQKKTPPWQIMPGGKGLRCEYGKWLIWKTPVPENVQLELTVAVPRTSDLLEICIHADLSSPLAEVWQSPPSYSFRFSEFDGEKHAIVKNTGKKKLSSIYLGVAEALEAKSMEELTILVERKNEELRFHIGPSGVIRVTDYFPSAGENMNRIALRTYSEDIKILRYRLRKLALPEKVTPLLAGDTLMELQLFPQAVEKYLSVARDFSSASLTDRALFKAYGAGIRIPEKNRRDKALARIKQMIAAKGNSFRYQEEVRELDVSLLWQDGDYAAALAFARSLLKEKPDSSVMQEILRLPHTLLPMEVQDEFLTLIGRSRNLKRLDLSDYGLHSLEVLERLPLTYLDCSGNQLVSLKGIEGMPLQVLIASGNHLESLEEIRRMPLKSLSFRNNNVKDLSVLAECPMLTLLDGSRNDIEDLSPLMDLPLERVYLTGNSISDIGPLGRLPLLRRLDLSRNPIRILSPIAGLPLERLRLDETLVEDLTSLKEMELTLLTLASCRRLKDLSPLSSMRSLEYLLIPAGVSGVEKLRSLPKLRVLSTKYLSSESLTTEEDLAGNFWKIYDRKRSPETKKR